MIDHPVPLTVMRAAYRGRRTNPSPAELRDPLRLGPHYPERREVHVEP
jgi:hypothetical protein